MPTRSEARLLGGGNVSSGGATMADGSDKPRRGYAPKIHGGVEEIGSKKASGNARVESEQERK